MDTSIFLAKVFSIYLVIMGVGLLLQRKRIQKIFIAYLENPVFLFLGGFLALVIGILIVVAHPQFTPDWRAIITIFGWLSLIKGIMHMFGPKRSLVWKRKLLDKPAFYYIAAPLIILLGLYLGCHGFFC